LPYQTGDERFTSLSQLIVDRDRLYSIESNPQSNTPQ
jgi:hypothetical protein